MNKIPSLLISLVLLTTAFCAHSQDTAKHAAKKPQGIVVPSEYHPITRPGYRHLGKNYKRDSTTLKAQATTAIKPDTTKPAITVAPPTPAYVDNTINGQYTTLTHNLGGYERGIVGTFYHNLMDTLNATRHQLKDSTAKLVTQAKTIADLESSATAKQKELAASQSKQMSFLGMDVSKSVYQYVMWGLVVVLTGLLIAVFISSGASRKEAAYRIQLYHELEEEQKAYKAKANEKEKKLARELQTERNKVDELLGKK